MSTNPHPTQIRFPASLATLLINQREKVNKYEKNRLIRAVDTFTCLKSTNICGVIKNYHSQLNTLLPICKLSRASFYNRLELCQEFGLLKIDGPHIRLISWDKVCAMHDLEFNGYINLNYDLQNEKQTIEHILNTVALTEHRRIIDKQIHKKVTINPDIQNAFTEYASNFLTQPVEFSPAALLEVQRITFAQGAPRELYNRLHKFNPDNNITVRSIRDFFRFKDHRSATYLKRNLQRRGLIDITKRAPVVHDYNLSIGVGRKGSKDLNCYHSWYDAEANTRTWFLTDQITFSKIHTS